MAAMSTPPDTPQVAPQLSPRASSNAAARLARIPAPLMFAAAFAAGAALQHGLALPLPGAGALTALEVAGTLLANASLLLTLPCLLLFALERTTLLPGSVPSRLVVRGPYRWSRNPLYVALVLAYAGFAGMYQLPWTLALLALPVAWLQWLTIPFEEARMHALFGEDYARYRRRVRRWL